MTDRYPLYPGGKNTAVAPYSPGLVTGNLVFVSGQGPINFETGEFELGSIEDETRLTMNNVAAVLHEAGCTFKDVGKVTVYLQRIEDFDRFNTVYREFVSEPYPARATVQAGLGSGISVEIDAIAVRPVA